MMYESAGMPVVTVMLEPPELRFFAGRLDVGEPAMAASLVDMWQLLYCRHSNAW